MLARFTEVPGHENMTTWPRPNKSTVVQIRGLLMLVKSLVHRVGAAVMARHHRRRRGCIEL